MRGTCPNCGTEDQPGDNCSKCGKTYSPTDLKDPRSAYSDATPELRTAKHLFVQIEKLRGFLDEWTHAPGTLQPEVLNYLKGQFLDDELLDWDVSRPAPYFGFEIPDAPGNYWYVWFDAPIGYVSNTAIWCQREGVDFDTWWRSPDTEIVHFIGKDIIYFHCLFWPAMLKTVGYTLPARVQVHGMLTLDGRKMSKSKGELIEASVYLKHLDPTYLRYFFASKLSTRMDDFDFGLDEFVNKVNSDLVGKVVNLASRTARFVKDVGLSATYPEDGGLFAKGALAGGEIAEAYEACDYQRAMRKVMELADRANEYVEKCEPWVLKKDPEKAKELQDVCTVALNLYRQLVVYLAPVLPAIAAKTGELLGKPIQSWTESQEPLVGTPVKPFKHLLKRAERAQLDTVLADQRALIAARTGADPAASAPADDDVEGIASEITIDDFGKVDLRVREGRAGRGRRGSEEAAEADPFAWQPRGAHRVRGHQGGLRARGPRGPLGHLCRQPEAAQDEVRHERGHGARRRSRREGHPRARCRRRRDAG